MSAKGNPVVGALVGWLAGLRFPVLFGTLALLFLVDLVVPDLIPFLDEVVLGLATALFAAWRRRRGGEEEPGP